MWSGLLACLLPNARLGTYVDAPPFHLAPAAPTHAHTVAYKGIYWDPPEEEKYEFALAYSLCLAHPLVARAPECPRTGRLGHENVFSVGDLTLAQVCLQVRAAAPAKVPAHLRGTRRNVRRGPASAHLQVTFVPFIFLVVKHHDCLQICTHMRAVWPFAQPQDPGHRASPQLSSWLISARITASHHRCDFPPPLPPTPAESLRTT